MKKERFVIEYIFDKASKKNLGVHLTTPSGLAEWFADEVIANGNTFEFTWDKQMLEAERIASVPDQLIQFRWMGEDDPEAYFGLRLHTNELTGALMLEITDFAEPSELESAISLWETQVKVLRRKLGL
ncbi:MAG: hypothetical protein LBR67_07480 [Dysgonamonadaceae bacterium]|jgi:uncharacterized protein YndB with AHSA1/START domain|nr:hypothetical protein [Dysgonamonadaceae bacterium]